MEVSEPVTCKELRYELQRFLDESLQEEFEKLRAHIRRDVVGVLSTNRGEPKSRGSLEQQAERPTKRWGLLPERNTRKTKPEQDLSNWTFMPKVFKSDPSENSNAPPRPTKVTAPQTENPPVLVGSQAGDPTRVEPLHTNSQSDADAVTAITTSQLAQIEKVQTLEFTAEESVASDRDSLTSLEKLEELKPVAGKSLAIQPSVSPSESEASFAHYWQGANSYQGGPLKSLQRLSKKLKDTARSSLTGGRRGTAVPRRGSAMPGMPHVLATRQTNNRITHGMASVPIVPHDALSACVELDWNIEARHSTEFGQRRSSLHGPPPPAARQMTVRGFFIVVCTSPIFDFCTGWLIAANALMIGIQTDTMARDGTDTMPKALWVGELVFLVCFSIELGVRILAFRCQLFFMPGWTWAIFDCVVVGMQIVEFLIDAATPADDEGGGNMGFMRLMRILRLVRVLRVVRIIRFLSELRTIVISILGSMRSLLWTLVLLLLGIYIVGIYFTQLVSDHIIQKATLTDSEETMNMRFANLSRSMLSLFQAMSGGLDWDEVCQPLVDNISWLQGIIFSLYISATVLALMNVVTGVFVEEALKSAKKEDTEYMSTYLMQMFQDADTEGTGNIGTEKFMKMCTEAGFINYIRSIDVDPDEAMALFHLLDLDGSNSIEYEEFVRGCLRLRGSAKAIDVLSLLHGVKAISTNLTEYMYGLENSMQEILSRVSLSVEDRQETVIVTPKVDQQKSDRNSATKRISVCGEPTAGSMEALDSRLRVKKVSSTTKHGNSNHSSARTSISDPRRIDSQQIEPVQTRTDAWDVAVREL